MLGLVPHLTPGSDSRTDVAPVTSVSSLRTFSRTTGSTWPPLAVPSRRVARSSDTDSSPPDERTADVDVPVPPEWSTPLGKRRSSSAAPVHTECLSPQPPRHPQPVVRAPTPFLRRRRPGPPSDGRGAPPRGRRRRGRP